MFGLVNRGNIYFLNCIVQCLIGIGKFCNLWMSHDCDTSDCGKQTVLQVIPCYATYLLLSLIVSTSII